MQKVTMRIRIWAGGARNSWLSSLLLAIVCFLAGTDAAMASADFSSVASNITTSSSSLPGIISALSYGLGLMFGVQGIVKLKEHVELPNQTPLRTGLIRLIVGGGLFALPIVYEAMMNSIGNQNPFTAETVGGTLSGWYGFGAGNSVNDVFYNILDSTQFLPGLFTAGAYLLGCVLGMLGLMKAREHVETPEQVTLKEPVIRFLAGGAMFALPTVMAAAMQTIDGGGGIYDVFSDIVQSLDLAQVQAGSSGVCDSTNFTFFGTPGNANGVGDKICNAVNGTSMAPGIASAFAYLFGIVLIIWGVLKIKDNVLNPQQTSIWEGVSRLMAGGAFFALPYLIEVVSNTLNGGTYGNSFSYTNFNGNTTGAGLDAMMVNFTGDIYGPMLYALNFFGYVAGVVLLMIGISRLLKSAQEGPRGPGGIGTIMTFIAAGAMISMAPLLGSFGDTWFGSNTALTNSTIMYTTGMNASEIAHVQAVISAVLQFMIVLGIVAFMRGIYIIRQVAEGNSQASLMAGITHMAGGSLACNLGPVMNAVQNTLGLTAYGVNFS